MQSAGDKFAIQVPNSQPKVLEIEFDRVVRSHVQWIDIRQQVAAYAIGVDELQHVGLLLDLLAVAAEHCGIFVLGPSHRRVLELEVLKDLVIKPVPALEQLGDTGEEQPAL